MKLFVSYSRRDATNYVQHIYEYLKDFGHDIFTDTKNIRGGEIWSEVIENNISICDYFVVLLTPASLNSSEVEKEVLFAIDKEKTIIPCILKPVIQNNNQIKWGLGRFQGVEFFDKYGLGIDLYRILNEKIQENPTQKTNDVKTQAPKFSASWYLERAKDFEELERYDEALDAYDKATKLEADNFSAWINKSIFLSNIAKYDKALEAIKEAIMIEPKNTDIWYHKACILEKMEDYQEALIALNIDLKIDSKDVKSWTSKANLLEKMKKYEEALESIDEIIKIDSANTDTFAKKGKILEKLKHYEDAINCYDHVLEMQPNTHAILISKGHVLQKLERYQEAIECYDKVLNSQPENIEVRIEKCVAILKSNKYQEAVTCYDETIQLVPNNKLLWINKGDILYKNLKQYKEAIDCYDNVLQLDPEDQDAKKNRENALYDLEKERFANLIDEANSYYEKKNYIKVIEICDKAIETDKENYISYLYTANALQQLSRYEEAIGCYDKVLTIDANNKEAIRNKEITIEILNKERFTSVINEIKKYYENKDYSKVFSLSDDVSVIFPNDPIPYLYKGNGFRELSRYEEAIQAYDKVLELDPKNFDAQNKRKLVKQLEKKREEQKKRRQINNWSTQGNMLLNHGKYLKAIEYYDNILKIDPKNTNALEKRKIIQEQLDKRSIEQKETIQKTTVEETAFPDSINTFTETRDLKRLKDNLLLAKVNISPQTIEIIPENDISIDTSPFKSFFIKRILEGMIIQDKTKINQKKLSNQDLLNYTIAEYEGKIKKIIINNYRENERLTDIINTITWVFTRMLEREEDNALSKKNRFFGLFR